MVPSNDNVTEGAMPTDDRMNIDARTSATFSRFRAYHLCWEVAPLVQEDSQLLLLALRWQVDKGPQHSLRDHWRGERITLGDNQFQDNWTQL